MFRLRSILHFFFAMILSSAALAQGPAELAAASPVPSARSAEPVAGLPEAPAARPVIEAAVIPTAIRVRQPSGHRFFDNTNLRLHLGVLAAETADLITTREVLRAGGTERNPLSRPLMRSGLGGQMAATYGLGEGTALLAAYLLHRTGHHRLERVVPIFLITIEGLATASNVRTSGNLRAQR